MLPLNLKIESLNDVLVEKKAKDEEDNDSDLEGLEVAEGAEIPGLKKSKKRVKKEEFEEWKGKVMSDEKLKPKKSELITKQIDSYCVLENTAKMRQAKLPWAKKNTDEDDE